MGPEDASVAIVEAKKSLRGRYGGSAVENGLHGSANAEAANREVCQCSASGPPELVLLRRWHSCRLRVFLACIY